MADNNEDNADDVGSTSNSSSSSSIIRKRKLNSDNDDGDNNDGNDDGDDGNDNHDSGDNHDDDNRASSSNNNNSNSNNDDTTTDTQVKKLPKRWRDGDWLCPNPQCGDHQYAYKQMCSRCKTKRPDDDNNDDSNKADGRRDRDGRRGKLPSNWREGDWFCPGCGNHKYAFKLYCECGQPKPQDLVRRDGSRGYDYGPRGGYDYGPRGGYDYGPRGSYDAPRGAYDAPRGFDGPRGGGYDGPRGGGFDGPRKIDGGAGKPGDWRCPNNLCPNNRGNVCFGSRPFCKKCGTPKPENEKDNYINPPQVVRSSPAVIAIPVGPSQSVISLVDRALLLSAKIPTFDVRYAIDNINQGLFNLAPVNLAHVHSLIYPVYDALHDAFLENPSYLLAQLESKSNPFKNDLASLATRHLHWESNMSNLSVSVSKNDANSRERFLHGERHKEVAHITPYPICPDVTKKQGRRWPDYYRGHCETSTCILAFKTSETRAIIALHVLPSIAELDPLDMYYFSLPLAYIS